MTDEEKKLVLDWCGLVFMKEKGYYGWYKGFGSQGLEWVADEPILDLNFYFRYAVPRLRRELREDGLIEFLQDWVDEAVLHRAQRDEAEAFGQALLKLIRR